MELVELEQIGFRSRAFNKGRYSSSEKAIVLFYEIVLEAPMSKFANELKSKSSI